MSTASMPCFAIPTAYASSGLKAPYPSDKRGIGKPVPPRFKHRVPTVNASTAKGDHLSTDTFEKSSLEKTCPLPKNDAITFKPENAYFQLKPQMTLSQQEEGVKNKLGSWAQEFLAKPHPDLGVPNRPVCPFIPTALKENSIWLRVISGKQDEAKLQALIQQARKDFLNLEPKSGKTAIYKTVVLTFPDVHGEDAKSLIDGLQRKLKPDFIKDGLMLGEFHALNETPGLHNLNFKPMKTPVSALAIRFMVDSDLAFLDDNKYRLEEKIAFLRSFLSKNFNRNSEQAKQALEKAKKELKAQQQH